MNEVLAKRLLGACVLVGVTLLLSNLLPAPQAVPPPEEHAKRVTYDLRPAQEVAKIEPPPAATAIEAPATPQVPAPQPATAKVEAPLPKEAAAPRQDAASPIAHAPRVAAKVAPKSPSRAAPKSQAKPGAAAQVASSAEPPTTAAPKPAPPAEAIPESKPEPKAEAPEPETTASVEPTPEPAAAPKTEPVVEAKAESSAEPAESAALPKEAWYVQIGVYAVEANAATSVAKLRTAGLQPKRATLSVKNGKVYRVRCGPFASEEEAGRSKARAVAIGFKDARVARD